MNHHLLSKFISQFLSNSIHVLVMKQYVESFNITNRKIFNVVSKHNLSLNLYSSMSLTELEEKQHGPKSKKKNIFHS